MKYYNQKKPVEKHQPLTESAIVILGARSEENLYSMYLFQDNKQTPILQNAVHAYLKSIDLTADSNVLEFQLVKAIQSLGMPTKIRKHFAMDQCSGSQTTKQFFFLYSKYY